MQNNILQQFGQSMLSPSYPKNRTTIREKPFYHYNTMVKEVRTDKENVPHAAFNMAHTLPVSNSSPEADVHTQDPMVKEGIEYKTTRVEDYNMFMPYTAYNFMAYRQRAQLNNSAFNQSTKSEDDVENDTIEHLRTGDMPSSANTSLSTQESTSPISTGSPSSPTQSICSPSGSEKSSHSSDGESVSSPDSESKQEKKLKRTSYTNEQLQSLLKIFHENPYPDSEMMETISLDLGLPESKIKIWFQNKRARWRKRVSNSTSIVPQHHFMPVSPMLSPVGSYGFMPHGQMMTSSPFMLPGYFNYASMHTPAYTSPSSNTAAARLQLTYPPMTTKEQQCSRMHQQQAFSPGLPNSYRASQSSSTMTSEYDRLLHNTHYICPS